MKGLTGVLIKFSEGLRTRKILPTLLEEVGVLLGGDMFTTSSNVFLSADERRVSVALYSAECLLYLHGALTIPVCVISFAESQTSFHGQGPATEHADTLRKSSHSPK